MFDLDACIFIQLTGLKLLQIEHISLNCASCWLPIARKNSLHIYGQCFNNGTIQRLDSITDQQIQNACSKSSIDCSSDYCEPGSINRSQQLTYLFSSVKKSNITNKRTIEMTLSIMFSMIALLILITFIVLIVRWKQNKKTFCCHFSQTTTTTTTTAEITRRHRQQIIDKNPAVIESVVTHGANMNVPSYPYRNYAYSNDETSNNKRKLYNPMFIESPTSDIRHHQQSVIVSGDDTSHHSQVYSENL